MAGFHRDRPLRGFKAAVRKPSAECQAYSLEPLHRTQGSAGPWPQVAARCPGVKGPPMVPRRGPHSQNVPALRKMTLRDRITWAALRHADSLLQ